MRYSESLIEEIREKNDIVEVIGEYVRLKRSGNSYMGLCPFHNEKTPSFSVSPDKQLYYCFGCHSGGNVFTFIREYNNTDFQEALSILADRCGVTLPERDMTADEEEARDERKIQLEILKSAASYYYYKLKTPAGKHGLDYFRERGLSDETIKSFGLGVSGKYSNELYKYLRSKNYKDDVLSRSGLFKVSEKGGFRDKFWNRVMFPITDLRGRVIGFGGRVMGEGKPKYLNSPETDLFNKRKNLFGLTQARHTAKDRIIICEGYMDVISMHQAGITNAVASLGTALTEEQAMLLKRYTKEVVIMYDSDGAGISAALRAVEIFDRAGLIVKVADLSPYKDPDEFIKDAGKEELESRIDNARNGFLFTIDRMSNDYDFTDPKSKTIFEHDVIRKILDFPDELERNNYLDSICSTYALPRDSMNRLLREYASSGRRIRRKEPEEYKKKASGKDSGPEEVLLYFLANYPEVYEEIKQNISPDDFESEFNKKAARNIIGKIEEGSVSTASLIDGNDSLEDQNGLASILSRDVPSDNEKELERAFTDVYIKFRKEVIERKLLTCSDAGSMTDLIRQKNEIEEFERSGRTYRLKKEGHR